MAAEGDCCRPDTTHGPTAMRKYRSLPKGAPNGSNRPVPVLLDHATARAENAKKRA